MLQCAGNGRGLLAGPPPGTPWRTGASANLRWSGVAVADLVELAGAPSRAVGSSPPSGADGAPDDPERVERSVPLDVGLERGLLAFGVNGAPLPGPWWTCPLDHARVLRGQQRQVGSEAGAHRRGVRRRHPDRPLPAHSPGSVPGPDDPSCWEMPVKSWVTSPASGAVVSGSVEVEGVAFSGAGRVSRVEVTVMVEGLGKLRCSAPTRRPGFVAHLQRHARFVRWGHRLPSARFRRQHAAASVGSRRQRLFGQQVARPRGLGVDGVGAAAGLSRTA